MNNLDANWLLRLMGVFFILAGLAGITGRWKGWYWRSQKTAYGYIPLGALFVMTSFELQMLQWVGKATWVIWAIYALIFAIGMWAFIRPPKFLKPEWIRTIEAQPPWIYKAMASQVKAGKDWRQRVENPQAIEDWIKEIKRQRPKTTKK
jgi:hypothetical protein